MALIPPIRSANVRLSSYVGTLCLSRGSVLSVTGTEDITAIEAGPVLVIQDASPQTETSERKDCEDGVKPEGLRPALTPSSAARGQAPFSSKGKSTPTVLAAADSWPWRFNAAVFKTGPLF